MSLSNLASGEFAAPIRRALFPGVASIADDEKHMVQTILSAIGIIGFVGLPATIGIAVTAPIFVPVLLGGNWNEVIPVIQVLAINGVTLVLYSNSHIIFYAVDRPHLTAYVSGLRFALLIPAVLFLVPKYGALGAAWALSGTSVIVTIAEYVLFFRLVTVRLSEVVDVVWRSIVATICMGIATYYFMGLLSGGSAPLPLLVQLALTAGVGAACYSAIVFALWFGIGRPDDGAEDVCAKNTPGIDAKSGRESDLAPTNVGSRQSTILALGAER